MISSAPIGRDAAHSNLPANCGFLIVTRHAKSMYNAEKLWTGWHDPDIIESELSTIYRCAQALLDQGYGDIDYCICSVLKRSIKTAHFLMDGLDRLWIDMDKTHLLNERALGNLQGTAYEAMDESLISDAPLPPDTSDTVHNLGFLQSLPYEMNGLSESDDDMRHRVQYCLAENVTPRIMSGQNILLVTHSGVMREILKRYKVIIERKPGEANEFDNVDCVMIKFNSSDGKLRAVSAKHLRVRRHNTARPE